MTITLSSPDLGKIFTVPTDDWATINKKVGLVNSDGKGYYWEFDRQLRESPNYEQLARVCLTWQYKTFPGLVNTAKQVVGSAKTAISLLEPLAEVLARLDARNVTSVSNDVKRHVFSVAQSLRESLDPIIDDASWLKEQIRQFHDANEAADANYGETAEPQRMVISPSSKRALRAIEHVLSVWQAIGDDLSDLLEEKIEIGIPLITELGVEEAIANWQLVQQEAQAFHAHADHQERHFNGDWLYDDGPQLDPNAWYRLTNDWLGRDIDKAVELVTGDFSLPTKRGDRLKFEYDLVMTIPADRPGQYWKFTRLGFGWYRLTNRLTGAAKSLDVYLDQILIIHSSDDALGKWWKFTPLVGSGWYRLTNKWLGPEKSVDNDRKKPAIADTHDYSGQYWKLTKIRE